MKGIPLIRLHRVPTNIRDENAIVVEVLFDEWHPIGYIPGKKVPNVTMAMNSDKITEVKLKNVITTSLLRAFVYIRVTKQEQWGKDQKDCIMTKYK